MPAIAARARRAREDRMRIAGAALCAAVAVSGCVTGGVGPGHVDALRPWRDRGIALARDGHGELADAARRGAATGLARGGEAPAEVPAAGALVVEARELDASDGVRIGGGAREVARVVGGPVA